MGNVTEDAVSLADARAKPHNTITVRAPTAEDGAGVWDLVAACPPLDRNSLYANLLQCTDFADTCAIARVDDGGAAVGWISGYIPPNEPHTFFLWQVAVHPDARGAGLPRRLLADILNRPACAGVSRMKTTITPDNAASWALFKSLAGWLGAPLTREPCFDADTHFKGRHDSETLVRIGPFGTPAAG